MQSDEAFISALWGETRAKTRQEAIAVVQTRDDSDSEGANDGVREKQ